MVVFRVSVVTGAKVTSLDTVPVALVFVSAGQVSTNELSLAVKISPPVVPQVMEPLMSSIA
jgi:hypothetical protein